MNILLQRNIWDEFEYTAFGESLRHVANVVIVDLVPFTERLTGLPSGDFVPHYIFGSNRFINVCRSKGYPTFKSFHPSPDYFATEHWLNVGKFAKWGQMKFHDHWPVFIKPVTEKFFTGTVVDCVDDLDKVQLATSFIGDEDEEMLIISEPMRIDLEVRFFVIGGQIITGSVYKDRGQGNRWRVDQSSDAWQACRQIIGGPESVKHPDEGYVIDLGLVNGQWKIVELNNLNSAGIYKCDTDAIARALKMLRQ